MNTKKCSHCGYIGKPVHDEYSSVLIDVFVWTFCITAAIITANIYIVLVGLAVTLWHIFTFRSHRCPRCGEWEMHRVHSLGHRHGVRHHGVRQ